MSDFDNTTVETLADLGKKASDPSVISVTLSGLNIPGLPSAIPVMWDRNAQKYISLHGELLNWREFPRTRGGVAKANTLGSFIDLVNRHKTPESVVFGDLDWRKPSLLAVIDYHPRRSREENEPAGRPDKDADWLKHRIAYTFPISEEWKLWTAGDGQKMNQGEFGALIEDRLPDLVAPTAEERDTFEEMLQTKMATPADLMKLARGLSVNIAGKVTSEKVLQSGEAEMIFKEEHTDGNGAKLVVPGAFMVAIPVFFMAEPVRIPVRLRYRVGGGTVSWFYQIFRPDLVIGEYLQGDRIRVEQDTALPFYEGAPEQTSGSV